MADKVYTVPYEFLVETLVESQQQYDVVKSMTKDMLIDQDEEKKSYIFSLFCELMWSNLTLISLVEQELETEDTPNAEGDQMVLSETALISLQNIVLARHHALYELQKLSVSTCIH
tara:strand:- start:355 stop:702 length:348 start_codon:yes stop_codon:yes gene_type:complete